MRRSADLGICMAPGHWLNLVGMDLAPGYACCALSQGLSHGPQMRVLVYELKACVWVTVDPRLAAIVAGGRQKAQTVLLGEVLVALGRELIVDALANELQRQPEELSCHLERQQESEGESDH